MYVSSRCLGPLDIADSDFIQAVSHVIHVLLIQICIPKQSGRTEEVGNRLEEAVAGEKVGQIERSSEISVGPVEGYKLEIVVAATAAICTRTSALGQSDGSSPS